MWHTVPHGEGWANKVEGNSHVTNTARTKADAQAKGLKVPIQLPRGDRRRVRLRCVRIRQPTDA